MQVTMKNQNKKRFDLSNKFLFLKDIHSTFYYYLLMVLIGVLFFSVSLFSNYFTTPLTGDYTSQQYAFYTNGYDDWWHFLTTGEFVLYDTNTFLGASNIGSNSFYYLFDPFFLPILIFPRAIIPQMMAIMTILKMALAGLTFHYYLRYIGVSQKTARLAGISYGFCGWTTWYLWFNHFTGIAALFPVVLLGVEKVLKEKKPWLLTLSLFLMGLCNFFFFFTFILCAFFYAMFRYFQQIKQYSAKENLKIIGIGFLGFFVGSLMACIVVLPAMVIALNAPRATNATYLNNIIEAFKNNDWDKFFKMIFSWEPENGEYKVYYPVLDYIFPVMSDRGTPLTKMGNESYDNVAGSLFCYTPFIIFLIPALIVSIKKKHFSVLVPFVIFPLMLFTPFAYYAFHGFTNAYSRWTLFITTSMITYVAFYIDDLKNQPKWHIFVGGGFALVCIWLAIYFAYHMSVTYEKFKLRYTYDILGEYGFLILEGVVASIYLTVVCTTLYFIKDKKYPISFMAICVAVESMIMGACTLEGHGYENYMNVNNGYNNNVALQSIVDRISKDDPAYYRCYSSQENSSARNDEMRHNYNGLGMFHSLYNFNDYPFLNWSQINDWGAPGSWSASYIEKRQNLDNFLGVKYYFIQKDKAFWGNDKAVALKSSKYRANVPLGFKDISDKYPSDLYFVYENEHFVDLGYGFDKVVTYDNLNEDDEIVEPTSLMGKTIQTEEMYINRAIVSFSNIKYIENKIDEANISDYGDYPLVTKQVPSSNYSIQYYDIHGDKESGREDCSSYSFASKLLDLSEYPVVTTKPNENKYNGRYVTVITPNSKFPYDESGMVIYLRTPYKDEYDINVYFTTIDESGEERFLTFDNHNDSHFSLDSTTRKCYRGFYVAGDENNKNAPKINKIIICNRKTRIFNYELYVEKGTDVFAGLDNLKAIGLNDVNYRTNHFDFTTNYDTNRVVVTQLPYEEGWSVTATDSNGNKKNIDVFTAQGGFVSFVAEKGSYSYSLDFYTPLLKEGSYISALGAAMFNLSYFVYILSHLSIIYDDLRKNRGFTRDFAQKSNIFNTLILK